MVKPQNDGRSSIKNSFRINYTSFRVFPDYFYTFSLWLSDKQTKLIDFVMIDTVLLCGGSNLSDWEHGPLEGPQDSFIAEDYWQWIEEQLRQST
jgi:hypothetical protein